MNPEVLCSQADYEAAAEALSKAMDLHARVRKTHNNEGYRALLDVSEFHDRALALAQAIAADRLQQYGEEVPD